MKQNEKRQVAGRIYEVVKRASGSITAFRKAAKVAGFKELHTNSHFWLPPAKKWAWDSAAKKWRAKTHQGDCGAAGDWQAVRLPSGVSLFQFCSFTEASADFLLFGTGNAYREQSRTTLELEHDLAVAAWRAIKAESEVSLPGGMLWIDSRELLAATLRMAKDEFGKWQGYSEMVPEMRTAMGALAIYAREKKRNPAALKDLRQAERRLRQIVEESGPQTNFVGGTTMNVATSEDLDELIAKEGAHRMTAMMGIAPFGSIGPNGEPV